MKQKFDRTFDQFIDDLGGFLWSCRKMGSTWDGIARDAGLSANTVARLANRKTQNPQSWTIWAVLKALDNKTVIRHSELAKYRGQDGRIRKAA